MAIKYKMAEDGKTIQISEKGLPMVVNDNDPEDIKEFAIDALDQYAKIPGLRSDIKDQRKEKEKLQELLKVFEEAELDLSDKDKVLEFIKTSNEALEFRKNVDDKKLIDAGEVETIKRQAAEVVERKIEEQKTNYEKKLGERGKEIESLTGTVYQLMVANQFHSSKFVKEKLALTPTAALRYFRDNLKVEFDDNGFRRVTAYYPSNNGREERVYSEERTGELADFDEALAMLVEKDPDHDSLLRGTGASGGGASGEFGGGSGEQVDNPFIKGENFNLTKQAHLLRDDPKLYERFKREAANSN